MGYGIQMEDFTMQMTSFTCSGSASGLAQMWKRLTPGLFSERSKVIPGDVNNLGPSTRTGS